jgi:hypothetical protein
MGRQVAKRTFTISAVTVALVSAGVVVLPTARGASALHFTSARCTTGSPYRHSISCEATWEGGTDPATGHWSRGINSWVDSTGQTDPAAHRTWVTGSCMPGWYSLYTVSVTITDADGQSIVQGVLGGGCN